MNGSGKRQDLLEPPLVDLGEIVNKFTSALASLFRPESCVHLSYTNYGGVRVMGVRVMGAQVEKQHTHTHKIMIIDCNALLLKKKRLILFQVQPQCQGAESYPVGSDQDPSGSAGTSA